MNDTNLSVNNEHWHLTLGVTVLIYARVKHLRRLKLRRIYVLYVDLSKYLTTNINKSTSACERRRLRAMKMKRKSVTKGKQVSKVI